MIFTDDIAKPDQSESSTQSTAPGGRMGITRPTKEDEAWELLKTLVEEASIPDLATLVQRGIDQGVISQATHPYAFKSN